MRPEIYKLMDQHLELMTFLSQSQYFHPNTLLMRWWTCWSPDADSTCQNLWHSSWDPYVSVRSSSRSRHVGKIKLQFTDTATCETSPGCALLQQPEEGSAMGAEATVTTDRCSICTNLNTVLNAGHTTITVLKRCRHAAVCRTRHCSLNTVSGTAK